MNKTYLIDTISKIPEMVELLHILNDVELPNHYLAGGAVTQAVWNRKVGNAPLYLVKDFDVVYFDRQQDKTEKEYEMEIESRTTHSLPVDVKNQAKVHEWYGAKFGNEIEPLKDSEDGIRMWLPCFAVGVHLVENTIEVFAPFGLEDQANMVVRPNKTAMSKENYDAMNRSFKKRWPDLAIQAW
ncbi:nucleotidyltransferase family protein [Saccharospirillum salsuginis]|uniref:Nucleotidyltransferase family protein n=1 Tax=Saccharospirillum salsuginis TaxID=418750 RepID=A0A918K7T5_9GAMM|nr:nucleotidyltransferase family protein [Saccharospirillum salsuginis]GGX53480.1 hypothetical protein GCM10007392_21240 [Saccharospirillum salsuginis]